MAVFITKLKTFTTDGLTVDELVELGALARVLRSEYETRQLPIPEWLDDQHRAVAREIESRVADQRAMRVREIKSQLASLETATEKRARLAAELAQLEPVS